MTAPRNPRWLTYPQAKWRGTTGIDPVSETGALFFDIDDGSILRLHMPLRDLEDLAESIGDVVAYFRNRTISQSDGSSGGDVHCQLDGCADRDGEQDRTADRQAPMGIDNLVSAPDPLPEGSTLCLAEAPAHHNEGDALRHDDVSRDLDHETGGEKKKTDEAHSGKPFPGGEFGKARSAPAEQSFHTWFLSMQARVRKCVGAGTPAHTISCVDNSDLSRSCEPSSGDKGVTA